MFWKNLVLTFGLSISCLTGLAQSLIVGIPNADVVPKGVWGITHESQSDIWRRNPSWNSFTFVTYGVLDRVELAVSYLNLAVPASNNRSLAVGWKGWWPIGPSRWRDAGVDVRVTAGQMVAKSVERNQVGGWLYGHLSSRFPGSKTRLTAGPSYGSEEFFGLGQRPFSVMVGIEQPLSTRWWLVADWFSGRHALANAIPALQYNLLHPRGAIIVGYKIPNDYQTQREAAILEVMIEIGHTKPS